MSERHSRRISSSERKASKEGGPEGFDGDLEPCEDNSQRARRSSRGDLGTSDLKKLMDGNEMRAVGMNLRMQGEGRFVHAEEGLEKRKE